MQMRTGPKPFCSISLYPSGRPSRPELSTDSDMTRKDRSMSRSFSTSRIQRELTQANGQSGSKKKSPRGLGAADVAALYIILVPPAGLGSASGQEVEFAGR